MYKRQPLLPSTSTAVYGTSLVRTRALDDTHSPADWSLVSFATPGGPNDVLPGAVDSDGDGIPDSAKLPGGTFAGVDLHAMGARRGQRDVFIEVDHMDAPTRPAVTPHRKTLDMVAAAFSRRGIHVHFDAGTLHTSNFDRTAMPDSLAKSCKIGSENSESRAA